MRFDPVASLDLWFVQLEDGEFWLRSDDPRADLEAAGISSYALTDSCCYSRLLAAARFPYTRIPTRSQMKRRVSK